MKPKIEEFLDETKVHITMSDRSIWEIPVRPIALSRADHYRHEFDDDLEKSLEEDTIPVFKDNYDIIDWAQNNMDWADVQKYAVCIKPPRDSNYEDNWCNADMMIIRSSTK